MRYHILRSARTTMRYLSLRTMLLRTMLLRTMLLRTMLLRTMLLRTMLPLVALALVVMITTDAYACPTCKDGLAENDPASAAQAAGYFYSILFMMAMPFLILGTLGSAAYLSIRRARAEQAQSGTVESANLASAPSTS